MKLPPPDGWIMKPSETFEAAYFRDVDPNPFLRDEFLFVWEALERDPRSCGQPRSVDDTQNEHWVYASPKRIGRPGLRIWWLIQDKNILLGGLAVVNQPDAKN